MAEKLPTLVIRRLPRSEEPDGGDREVLALSLPRLAEQLELIGPGEGGLQEQFERARQFGSHLVVTAPQLSLNGTPENWWIESDPISWSQLAALAARGYPLVYAEVAGSRPLRARLLADAGAPHPQGSVQFDEQEAGSEDRRARLPAIHPFWHPAKPEVSWDGHLREWPQSEVSATIRLGPSLTAFYYDPDSTQGAPALAAREQLQETALRLLGGDAPFYITAALRDEQGARLSSALVPFFLKTSEEAPGALTLVPFISLEAPNQKAELYRQTFHALVESGKITDEELAQAFPPELRQALSRETGLEVNPTEARHDGEKDREIERIGEWVATRLATPGRAHLGLAQPLRDTAITADGRDSDGQGNGGDLRTANPLGGGGREAGHLQAFQDSLPLRPETLEFLRAFNSGTFARRESVPQRLSEALAKRGYSDGGADVPEVQYSLGRAPQARAETKTPDRPPEFDQLDILPSEGAAARTRLADLVQLGGSSGHRLKRNVDALRVLAALTQDGRRADAEERQLLGGFLGWGALPELFEPAPNDLGQSQRALRGEINRLLDGFSKDSGAAARRALLNSHYTDPLVINAMWQGLRQMGIENAAAQRSDGKARVLEPGSGAGWFAGFLPEPLADSVKITGVEQEPVSANVAQHLYPEHDFRKGAFEEAALAPDSFDAAIGNVPFGGYRAHDPAYAHLNAPLHDYFVAKSLDLVRPGGVVMLLTSPFTLDKKNSRIRESLRDKGQLLSAVRLPAGTFKHSAGTESGADLLVLRRRPMPLNLLPEAERARALETEPDWVSLGRRKDPLGGSSMFVNRFFLDNPGQVIGRLERSGTLYGGGKEGERQPVARLYDSAGRPRDGESLRQAVGAALTATLSRLPQGALLEPLRPAAVAEPSASAVKEGGYYLTAEGALRRNVGGFSQEPALSADDGLRIGLALKLRDVARSALQAQLDGASAAKRSALRADMGRVYDGFVKAYGRLSEGRNRHLLRQDPDGPFLFALEARQTDGSIGKAAVFEKDVLRADALPTAANNPKDALLLTLARHGQLDLESVASLLACDPLEAETRLLDEGLAFRDPARGGRLSEARVYLSGNVREKLRLAEGSLQQEPGYATNVAALRKVQPPQVGRGDIAAQFGASWIPPEVVETFLTEEVLGLAPSDHRGRRQIEVAYEPQEHRWTVEALSSKAKAALRRPDVTAIYGRGRSNAVTLAEKLLNGRSLIITRDGKIDREATSQAEASGRALQERFATWVWREEKRAKMLEARYNEAFNAFVPPRFDGESLHLGGLAAEWKSRLRPHQRASIERTLYGNTLLAHSVGTGKTATLIASAMEAKRLGLATKPMIAAHGPTIHGANGFAQTLREMYPQARALVWPNKKAVTAEERKRFFASVATGEWDIVLVPHEALDLLPVTPQRERAYLKDQLESYRQVLGERQADDPRSRRRAVKTIEASVAKLETRIKELNAAGGRKDNTVYFDELGVDRLLVDEFHYYKNLYVPTQLARLKGLPSGESQRAANMLLRTRFLADYNRARLGTDQDSGLVVATATPVDNSLVELHNLQRYLQPGLLKQAGLQSFDAWARVFTETVTRLERDVAGRFQQVTRLSRYNNLPELQAMVGQVMDLVNRDEIDDLSVPKCHVSAIEIEPPKPFIAFMGKLAERASSMRPDGRDNMLMVSTHGRLASLDLRLLHKAAPSSGKLEAAADTISRISQAHPDKTQLVYFDIGVHPSKPSETGDVVLSDWRHSLGGEDDAFGFSVRQSLKEALVKKGVASEKIIDFFELKGEARTAAERRLKTGDALVAIGSTAALGTGVNPQDRVIADHHLDVPWVPSAVEQRRGRMERHGNRNPEVYSYRYLLKGSFDAFAWQLQEAKGRFIEQILRGKTDVRSVEEKEESISAAELSALASGEPLQLVAHQLAAELERLESAERVAERRLAEGRQQVARLEEENAALEASLPAAKEQAEAASAALQRPAQLTGESVETHHEGHKKAGEALTARLRTLADKPLTYKSHSESAGSWRGLPVVIGRDGNTANPFLLLALDGGTLLIEDPLLRKPQGLMHSLDHRLRQQVSRPGEMAAEIQSRHGELARMKEQLETAAARSDAETLTTRRAELRRLQAYLKAAPVDKLLLAAARAALPSDPRAAYEAAVAKLDSLLAKSPEKQDRDIDTWARLVVALDPNRRGPAQPAPRFPPGDAQLSERRFSLGGWAGWPLTAALNPPAGENAWDQVDEIKIMLSKSGGHFRIGNLKGWLSQRGDFAVHPAIDPASRLPEGDELRTRPPEGQDRWQLTHLSTGLRVQGYFPEKEKAQTVARRLQALMPSPAWRQIVDPSQLQDAVTADGKPLGPTASSLISRLRRDQGVEQMMTPNPQRHFSLGGKTMETPDNFLSGAEMRDRAKELLGHMISDEGMTSSFGLALAGPHCVLAAAEHYAALHQLHQLSQKPDNFRRIGIAATRALETSRYEIAVDGESLQRDLQASIPLAPELAATAERGRFVAAAVSRLEDSGPLLKAWRDAARQGAAPAGLREKTASYLSATGGEGRVKTMQERLSRQRDKSLRQELKRQGYRSEAIKTIEVENLNGPPHTVEIERFTSPDNDSFYEMVRDEEGHLLFAVENGNISQQALGLGTEDDERSYSLGKQPTPEGAEAETPERTKAERAKEETGGSAEETGVSVALWSALAGLGIGQDFLSALHEIFGEENLSIQQRRWMNGPLIVHSYDGWGHQDVPDWLKSAARQERTERTLEQARRQSTDLPGPGPAELTAVMMPATYASPLTGELAEIYLWASAEAIARYAPEGHAHRGRPAAELWAGISGGASTEAFTNLAKRIADPNSSLGAVHQALSREIERVVLSRSHSESHAAAGGAPSPDPNDAGTEAEAAAPDQALDLLAQFQTNKRSYSLGEAVGPKSTQVMASNLLEVGRGWMPGIANRPITASELRAARASLEDNLPLETNAGLQQIQDAQGLPLLNLAWQKTPQGPLQLSQLAALQAARFISKPAAARSSDLPKVGSRSANTARFDPKAFREGLTAELAALQALDSAQAAVTRDLRSIGTPEKEALRRLVQPETAAPAHKAALDLLEKQGAAPDKLETLVQTGRALYAAVQESLSALGDHPARRGDLSNGVASFVGEVLQTARRMNPRLNLAFLAEVHGQGDGLLDSGAPDAGRQAVAGLYDYINRLARLSLDVSAGHDLRETAFHEIWHSLENLFTDKERLLLGQLYPDTRGRLDLPPAARRSASENAAYAFGQWAAARDRGEAPAAPVFGQAEAALSRLGGWLRKRGIDQAEALFEQAYDGSIGHARWRSRALGVKSQEQQEVLRAGELQVGERSSKRRSGRRFSLGAMDQSTDSTGAAVTGRFSGKDQVRRNRAPWRVQGRDGQVVDFVSRRAKQLGTASASLDEAPPTFPDAFELFSKQARLGSGKPPAEAVRATPGPGEDAARTPAPRGPAGSGAPSGTPSGTPSTDIAATLGFDRENRQTLDSLRNEMVAIARRMNPTVEVELAERLVPRPEDLDQLIASGADPEKLPAEVAGFYEPGLNLVALALHDRFGDPRTHAFHETWHSLEQFLTPAEQEVLQTAFPATGRLSHKERVAYAFQEWALARAEAEATSGEVATAFGKVDDALLDLRGWAHGRGFHNAAQLRQAVLPPAVEEVFRRGYDGEIGLRVLGKEQEDLARLASQRPELDVHIQRRIATLQERLRPSLQRLLTQLGENAPWIALAGAAGAAGAGLAGSGAFSLGRPPSGEPGGAESDEGAYASSLQAAMRAASQQAAAELGEPWAAGELADPRDPTRANLPAVVHQSLPIYLLPQPERGPEGDFITMRWAIAHNSGAVLSLNEKFFAPATAAGVAAEIGALRGDWDRLAIELQSNLVRRHALLQDITTILRPAVTHDRMAQLARGGEETSREAAATAGFDTREVLWTADLGPESFGYLGNRQTGELHFDEAGAAEWGEPFPYYLAKQQSVADLTSPTAIAANHHVEATLRTFFEENQEALAYNFVNNYYFRDYWDGSYPEEFLEQTGLSVTNEEDSVELAEAFENWCYEQVGEFTFGDFVEQIALGNWHVLGDDMAGELQDALVSHFAAIGFDAIRIAANWDSQVLLLNQPQKKMRPAWDVLLERAEAQKAAIVDAEAVERQRAARRQPGQVEEAQARAARFNPAQLRAEGFDPTVAYWTHSKDPKVGLLALNHYGTERQLFGERNVAQASFGTHNILPVYLRREAFLDLQASRWDARLGRAAKALYRDFADSYSSRGINSYSAFKSRMKEGDWEALTGKKDPLERRRAIESQLATLSNYTAADNPKLGLVTEDGNGRRIAILGNNAVPSAALTVAWDRLRGGGAARRYTDLGHEGLVAALQGSTRQAVLGATSHARGLIGSSGALGAALLRLGFDGGSMEEQALEGEIFAAGKPIPAPAGTAELEPLGAAALNAGWREGSLELALVGAVVEVPAWISPGGHFALHRPQGNEASSDIRFVMTHRDSGTRASTIPIYSAEEAFAATEAVERARDWTQLDGAGLAALSASELAGLKDEVDALVRAARRSGPQRDPEEEDARHGRWEHDVMRLSSDAGDPEHKQALDVWRFEQFAVQEIEGGGHRLFHLPSGLPLPYRFDRLEEAFGAGEALLGLKAVDWRLIKISSWQVADGLAEPADPELRQAMAAALEAAGGKREEASAPQRVTKLMITNRERGALLAAGHSAREIWRMTPDTADEALREAGYDEAKIALMVPVSSEELRERVRREEEQEARASTAPPESTVVPPADPVDTHRDPGQAQDSSLDPQPTVAVEVSPEREDPPATDAAASTIEAAAATPYAAASGAAPPQVISVVPEATVSQVERSGLGTSYAAPPPQPADPTSTQRGAQNMSMRPTPMEAVTTAQKLRREIEATLSQLEEQLPQGSTLNQDNIARGLADSQGRPLLNAALFAAIREEAPEVLPLTNGYVVYRDPDFNGGWRAESLSDFLVLIGPDGRLAGAPGLSSPGIIDRLADYAGAYTGDDNSPEVQSLRRQALEIARTINPHTAIDVVARLYGEGDVVKASGAGSGDRRPVSGLFFEAFNTIAISHDASRGDPIKTLYHELYHSIEPLLSDRERTTIAEAAAGRAPGLEPREEAAEAFADWALERAAGAQSRRKGAWGRLQDFFKKIDFLHRDKGFKTFDALFDAIAAGEVAKRAPLFDVGKPLGSPPLPAGAGQADGAPLLQPDKRQMLEAAFAATPGWQEMSEKQRTRSLDRLLKSEASQSYIEAARIAEQAGLKGLAGQLRHSLLYAEQRLKPLTGLDLYQRLRGFLSDGTIRQALFKAGYYGLVDPNNRTNLNRDLLRSASEAIAAAKAATPTDLRRSDPDLARRLAARLGHGKSAPTDHPVPLRPAEAPAAHHLTQAEFVKQALERGEIRIQEPKTVQSKDGFGRPITTTQGERLFIYQEANGQRYQVKAAEVNGDASAAARAIHTNLVRAAHARGRYLPDSVIAEFPDLLAVQGAPRIAMDPEQLRLHQGQPTRAPVGPASSARLGHSYEGLWRQAASDSPLSAHGSLTAARQEGRIAFSLGKDSAPLAGGSNLEEAASSGLQSIADLERMMESPPMGLAAAARNEAAGIGAPGVGAGVGIGGGLAALALTSPQWFSWLRQQAAGTPLETTFKGLQDNLEQAAAKIFTAAPSGAAGRQAQLDRLGPEIETLAWERFADSALLQQRGDALSRLQKVEAELGSENALRLSPDDYQRVTDEAIEASRQLIDAELRLPLNGTPRPEDLEQAQAALADQLGGDDTAVLAAAKDLVEASGGNLAALRQSLNDLRAPEASFWQQLAEQGGVLASETNQQIQQLTGLDLAEVTQRAWDSISFSLGDQRQLVQEALAQESLAAAERQLPHARQARTDRPLLQLAGELFETGLGPRTARTLAHDAGTLQEGYRLAQRATGGHKTAEALLEVLIEKDSSEPTRAPSWLAAASWLKGEAAGGPLARASETFRQQLGLQPDALGEALASDYSPWLPHMAATSRLAAGPEELTALLQNGRRGLVAALAPLENGPKPNVEAALPQELSDARRRFAVRTLLSESLKQPDARQWSGTAAVPATLAKEAASELRSYSIGLRESHAGPLEEPSTARAYAQALERAAADPAGALRAADPLLRAAALEQIAAQLQTSRAPLPEGGFADILRSQADLHAVELDNTGNRILEETLQDLGWRTPLAERGPTQPGQDAHPSQNEQSSVEQSSVIDFNAALAHARQAEQAPKRLFIDVPEEERRTALSGGAKLDRISGGLYLDPTQTPQQSDALQARYPASLQPPEAREGYIAAALAPEGASANTNRLDERQDGGARPGRSGNSNARQVSEALVEVFDNALAAGAIVGASAAKRLGRAAGDGGRAISREVGTSRARVRAQEAGGETPLGAEVARAAAVAFNLKEELEAWRREGASEANLKRATQLDPQQLRTLEQGLREAAQSDLRRGTQGHDLNAYEKGERLDQDRRQLAPLLRDRGIVPTVEQGGRKR